jgi:hypothetical protein
MADCRLTPVILATQEDRIQGLPQANSSNTLSQKYPTQKRAAGVTQVVEHLPSKREAHSSNPSAAKKKRLLVDIT